MTLQFYNISLKIDRYCIILLTMFHCKVMPASGAVYIVKGAKEINREKVVSIIGSCWSMDRKKNCTRIEKTYRLLVYGDTIPVAERS